MGFPGLNNKQHGTSRGDQERIMWNFQGRLGNRNFKSFKKNSVIAKFKAINERTSEWACSLNLDKQFQRYFHFSVPKKGGFMDKS